MSSRACSICSSSPDFHTAMPAAISAPVVATACTHMGTSPRSMVGVSARRGAQPCRHTAAPGTAPPARGGNRQAERPQRLPLGGAETPGGSAPRERRAARLGRRWRGPPRSTHYRVAPQGATSCRLGGLGATAPREDPVRIGTGVERLGAALLLVERGDVPSPYRLTLPPGLAAVQQPRQPAHGSVRRRRRQTSCPGAQLGAPGMASLGWPGLTCPMSGPMYMDCPTPTFREAANK